MSLKQYKPITSSQRGLVLVDRAELHKGKPFKKLTKGLSKSGGRNNFEQEFYCNDIFPMFAHVKSSKELRITE